VPGCPSPCKCDSEDGCSEDCCKSLREGEGDRERETEREREREREREKIEVH
jgi:hypothetical protein